MTIKQLASLIGKQGLLRVESLHVRVEILDVKEAYGSTRVLITPVNGSGEQWVTLERMIFNG
jgi:hypothetical protein